jgi:hypothetical protein
VVALIRYAACKWFGIRINQTGGIMGRQVYTLNKEKKGCFGYAVGIGLMLFFAVVIFASIANIIYDFGFSSIVAGLLMIGTSIGLGYVVLKSNFNTKIQTVTIDEDGIEYTGWPMMADKKYVWTDTKLMTGNTPGKNIPFINVSFPSGLPLAVHETRLDNYDEFVENVKYFHSRAQQKLVDQFALKFNVPQITEKPSSADARTLSHQRAVEWWEREGREDAICDGCNRPLTKPAGFLVGSYLYCHECARDKF